MRFQVLPTSYFDRLTQAMGIRGDRGCTERRIATRIPASFRPEVFPVIAQRILKPYTVRARDISAGGIGLLLTKELVAVKTIVLSVLPRGGDEPLVMLCGQRRAAKLDSVSVIGGYVFERLLYPGQMVVPGQIVTEMLWVDVSGEKAGEDPFNQARRAG